MLSSIIIFLSRLFYFDTTHRTFRSRNQTQHKSISHVHIAFTSFSFIIKLKLPFLEYLYIHSIHKEKTMTPLLRGREALSVNLPEGTETLSAHGSDWLWAVLAIYLLSFVSLECGDCNETNPLDLLCQPADVLLLC